MNDEMIRFAAEELEEYYSCTGDLDDVPETFREFIDWQSMAREYISSGLITLNCDENADEALEFHF